MKFHELIEVCSHFCGVRMEFTKFETVTIEDFHYLHYH